MRAPSSCMLLSCVLFNVSSCRARCTPCCPVVCAAPSCSCWHPYWSLGAFALVWSHTATGADSHKECRQGIPEDDKPTGPWYRRDLMMSWRVLVENVTDPSHVPFSHHGIQGELCSPHCSVRGLHPLLWTLLVILASVCR